MKALEGAAKILGQETASQSEEVTLKAARLESELEQAGVKLKAALEAEAKLRHEYLEQVVVAKEAQEHYERKLVQHAADLEQLNSSREKLEQYRVQVASGLENAARLQQELDSGKTS